MANTKPTHVVTGEVRFSYANVWEPRSIQGGEPKYSLSIIIPKSDTKTVEAIEKAVDAAIDDGLGKFGGKRPNKAAIKTPLRDGDIDRDGDPAYADAWFINANSKNAPQIVGPDRVRITNQADVYSGCYGRVSVDFFAFNTNGNRGVACGLGNLQKLRDGEPLGGGTTAADDFGAPESDFDDLLG